jgi:hypothetical protein
VTATATSGAAATATPTAPADEEEEEASHSPTLALRSVSYSVSGAANDLIVSYFDGAQLITVIQPSLPWSLVVSLEVGSEAIVRAVGSDETGTLACEARIEGTSSMSDQLAPPNQGVECLLLVQ